MELSESDFSQNDMVPCQTNLILVPSIEGSRQKAFLAADRDGTPSISFQKLLIEDGCSLVHYSMS